MKTFAFFLLVLLCTVTVTAQGVGIGTSTPNAQLELGSTLANRKIILFESAVNDHQFSGFGINTGLMRYQVAAQSTDHVFYAGANSSSSVELMRISGYGNVGVNLSSPSNLIDIRQGVTRTGTHASFLPLYVTGDYLSGNIAEFRHADGTVGLGIGHSKIYAAGSNESQNLAIIAKGSEGNILLEAGDVEAMRITPGKLVGIGTTTPHAPLQFENVNANRKMVLYETTNNDHQYYGLGVNSGLLRYQVDGAASAHVFYAAVNGTTSNELLRIRGNGSVRITTSTFNFNRKLVLFQDGVDNDHQYSGFGINAGIMRYQVAATADNHVFYAAANSTSSNELMRIKGNGNVGIGTSAPNAPLQFSNTAASRKIVLTEVANNDHQFSGLGTAANSLHYQTAATTTDHVFRAGASSSTSNELMRIKGNGNVGIGTTTPNAPLQFNNTAASRKVVLSEGANNNHQFNGFGTDQFGISGDYMRYQVASTLGGHIFYAGTSSTTSNALMSIYGDGSVGIGTNSPEHSLDVNGSARVQEYLHVGPDTADTQQTLGVNGNAKITGNASITGTLQLGYQVVSQNFVIPALAVATNTCNCPAGFKVLGGGWKGDNIDVIGSYPEATGNGWMVDALNVLPGPNDVYIYAICAQILPE